MDGLQESLLYKVLVIGNSATGKTSIIKRYVHNVFSFNCTETMGADFALKEIQWNDSLKISIQFWDIAGQQRFRNMTRIYYKNAVAVFIVFDVTTPKSFEDVLVWKHDVDAKVLLSNNQPIIAVLLANKSDLGGIQRISLDAAQMNKFCDDNGFLGWFETSAKDGTGIEKATKFLISEIVKVCSPHAPSEYVSPIRIQRPLREKNTSCCGGDNSL